jgi:hypothetical protein
VVYWNLKYEIWNIPNVPFLKKDVITTLNNKVANDLIRIQVLLIAKKFHSLQNILYVTPSVFSDIFDEILIGKTIDEKTRRLLTLSGETFSSFIGAKLRCILRITNLIAKKCCVYHPKPALLGSYNPKTSFFHCLFCSEY